jgi:hypothetical protein
MGLSRTKSLRQFQDLQNQRRELLQSMTGTKPLIIGTVTEVLRRCGNPSCHCADKPGHRQTLLLFFKNGKRICKFIRREDVDWVREAWERYRMFKKDLRVIRTLQKQEFKLLGVQMRLRNISYK